MGGMIEANLGDLSDLAVRQSNNDGFTPKDSSSAGYVAPVYEQKKFESEKLNLPPNRDSTL